MAFGVGEKENGQRTDKIGIGSSYGLYGVQNYSVTSRNFTDCEIN